MTGWKVVAVLMAVTGCAGAGRFTMPGPELASGHWSGSIDRDGWWRPLFLDIEREQGAWRGKWRSLVAGPSMALEDLEVQGDEVRFETGQLRFVGHLVGDTLSGTVIDVPAGTPAGEFSVSLDDPAQFVGG